MHNLKASCAKQKYPLQEVIFIQAGEVEKEGKNSIQMQISQMSLLFVHQERFFQTRLFTLVCSCQFI